MAVNFDCDHGDIARILKAAGWKWHKHHRLTHLLTEVQKGNWILIPNLHFNHYAYCQILKASLPLTMNECCLTICTGETQGCWLWISVACQSVSEKPRAITYTTSNSNGRIQLSSGKSNMDRFLEWRRPHSLRLAWTITHNECRCACSYASSWNFVNFYLIVSAVSCHFT